MKKPKSNLPGHTIKSKLPTGEFQGTAVHNKIGKAIDITIANRIPGVKKNKPKKLA